MTEHHDPVRPDQCRCTPVPTAAQRHSLACPLFPAMGAGGTAAVLTDHAPRTDGDALRGWRCGWRIDGRFVTLAEFARHQADALAAPGFGDPTPAGRPAPTTDPNQVTGL